LLLTGMDGVECDVLTIIDANDEAQRLPIG
jgi:hypothetical protein